MQFIEARERFRTGKGSIRCNEVVQILTSLGFAVHPAKAGHKVVKHPGLSGWHGTNFDCGHGKNPVVKNCYIQNLMRVLDQFSDDLGNRQEGP